MLIEQSTILKLCQTINIKSFNRNLNLEEILLENTVIIVLKVLNCRQQKIKLWFNKFKINFRINQFLKLPKIEIILLLVRYNSHSWIIKIFVIIDQRRKDNKIKYRNSKCRKMFKIKEEIKIEIRIIKSINMRITNNIFRMSRKNHKIVIQKIIIKMNNMYLHFIKIIKTQLKKITLCRNLHKIL